MKFDIGFITAETHTPEYLMHKYWARKPHNVINKCISMLTPESGVVLDPFCGSGVTLRESSLLGRKSYGFDLNPVAVLISSVLINPPSLEEFNKTFIEIYDSIYEKYGFLYKTADEKEIRYLSHKIVSKCKCGKVLKQSDCIVEGKKLICPFCHNQVRFNLESMVSSEIFDITLDKDKNYEPSESELKRQAQMSDFVDSSAELKTYDYFFPENRRILAFGGIKTSDFFTRRNFLVLSSFADLIWEISDEKIRNCCLLLLTASVAQCSRLIAHRNNLSTGGPAWSVPGFWIPQEHLETNPFIHIRARLKKFNNALLYLEHHKGNNQAFVYKQDSLKALNSDEFNSIKADLIFLDPPYGDSVPYTEFSNIWNSFLKEIPCSDDDISVSDRIDKSTSWSIYSEKLNLFMKTFNNHLKENGKLLITFNNNDMRAWFALLSALQKNGFICKSVFYQIPAVISSKAQMSIDTSYISDVYSVYSYCPEQLPTKDLSSVISHLCFIANSRAGTVTKIVLDREFILCWLKNNIDSDLLDKKEEIISSIFNYEKTTKLYVLKEEYKKDVPVLKDAITKAMHNILNDGPISLLDCYVKVNDECSDFGVIEFADFKALISSYAISNGMIYGEAIKLF